MYYYTVVVAVALATTETVVVVAVALATTEAEVVVAETVIIEVVVAAILMWKRYHA